MANTDGPWVRFFASDWLAGTRGMTAAETGVYITLIATMYEHGNSIVRDDARLARVCGLPTRNFSQILDRLIETDKIIVDDLQNLWGRKVELEVRNRSARAQKSRDAALTKHQRKQGQSSANAPAKQEPSTSQTVPRARVSEPEPDSKDEESLEASQRKKRAARLPADWIPSEPDKHWLRTKWPGITSGIYAGELEKFRNYWLAKGGKDATKLDWSRTWQNWMMTAQERTGSRPPAKEHATDVLANLIGEMEHAERLASERATPPNERHALPGPRQRDY